MHASKEQTPMNSSRYVGRSRKSELPSGIVAKLWSVFRTVISYLYIYNIIQFIVFSKYLSRIYLY